MKHVTNESTLKEGVDTTVAPDKALVEQEQQLLAKYKVAIDIDFRIILCYACDTWLNASDYELKGSHLIPGAQFGLTELFAFRGE